VIWQILGIVLLVIANGLFVAAEFALVKVRMSELEAGDSTRSSRLVQHMLGHLDAYLSAGQLGITLASLGLGWAGEPLVARMLEPAFLAAGLPVEKVHFLAFPIAFATITFLHLTVGEQAPKIAAIQAARSTALLIAYPLAIFYKIFKPFIWLINVSSNGILRLAGFDPVSGHDEAITEAEIRTILTQSAAMGHLGASESRIIEKVLDLEGKIARSYMVPRNKIQHLDRNAPLTDSLEIAARSGHTRFPLCDGGLDQVHGLVHVKDVFNAMNGGSELKSLDEVARELSIFPETIQLDSLFRELQKAKSHMAILADEHGGVSGMITLENIIEQMVGPIEDEFDAEAPLVVNKGGGRFEVDAACPVAEFAEKCEVNVPAEVDADTIGGVLNTMLGHIPRIGETVNIDGRRISVLEADRTHVTRLLVEPLAPEEPLADPI
jgi:CBS domain containing-hemolysin-like protein